MKKVIFVLTMIIGCLFCISLAGDTIKYPDRYYKPVPPRVHPTPLIPPYRQPYKYWHWYGRGPYFKFDFDRRDRDFNFRLDIK